LFSLNWLAGSMPLLLTATMTPTPYESHWSAAFMPYASGVLLLIFATVLWILSPMIARFVSSDVDSSVSLGGLSRSDLYNFAFVFLGLFFILSSFADVVNWIHYFTLSDVDPRNNPHIHNFYNLTKPCLTFALGVVFLIGSPHWTKKLVDLDKRYEES